VIGWGYTTGNYSATPASPVKKRAWALPETCPERCGEAREIQQADSADNRARAAGAGDSSSKKIKSRLQNDSEPGLLKFSEFVELVDRSAYSGEVVLGSELFRLGDHAVEKLQAEFPEFRAVDIDAEAGQEAVWRVGAAGC